MRMRWMLIASLVVAGCVFEDVPAGLELCNGLDDDNDPMTDDGADEPELGVSCDGSDGDTCTAERIACRGGRLVCNSGQPGTGLDEICNGLDDDCDREVDEDFSFGTDPKNCGFCRNACTNANGTTACEAGACVPACDAGAVDCNGNVSDGCEVFRDRDPTCQTIVAMGSLAGDAAMQSIELTGTDEVIFDVVVLEQSTGKVPLTATMVLTAPPEVNFDLVVTCGACGGTVMGSSTNPAGQPDVVSFRAEDNDFVNDARTLHVELRFAGGAACAGPWHLKVSGATPVAATTCPSP